MLDISGIPAAGSLLVVELMMVVVAGIFCGGRGKQLLFFIKYFSDLKLVSDVFLRK